MKKDLIVTMPDGSRYSVPVIHIANHRAKYYADEFGGLESSLKKDTLPLFESDEYEIQDWAANNMNWSDVEQVAEIAERPDCETDYQEGWVNGEKEVV